MQKRGNQLIATKDLNNSRDLANHTYTKLIKIARIALKDKSDTVRLDLNSKRKVSFGNWFEQAMIFYDGILSDNDTVSKMKDFNIGRENLLDGKKLLNDVSAANLNQEKAKGESR